MSRWHSFCSASYQNTECSRYQLAFSSLVVNWSLACAMYIVWGQINAWAEPHVPLWSFHLNNRTDVALCYYDVMISQIPFMSFIIADILFLGKPDTLLLWFNISKIWDFCFYINLSMVLANTILLVSERGERCLLGILLLLVNLKGEVVLSWNFSAGGFLSLFWIFYHVMKPAFRSFSYKKEKDTSFNQKFYTQACYIVK